MNEAEITAGRVVDHCRIDFRHWMTDASKDWTEAALGWQEPADDADLSPGEIHLWRVWLDQSAPLVEQCRSWLSVVERERAGRFCFEREQVRYVVGRGLLRMMLGRYLKLEPARICFSYGKFGKPALDILGFSKIRFNLSHSDALALYAFSTETELGVDVERVRMVEDMDAIMDRHFPSSEVLRWRGLSNTEQAGAFLRYWVRREAGAKRSGRGLAEALCDKDAILKLGRVQDFTPAPGYVGALAW